MTILLKPFALLLGWLYTFTGNYGLAIILFCLVFKVLLFPISIKGRKGMLDMSRLSEKQKELQQKYGRDRARYSQAISELYVTENVKPSSGCLWSFLPLPLLFALYGVVSSPFTHLMKLTSDQVQALTSYVQSGGSGARIQLSIAQSVYENFDGVRAALPDVAAQIQSAGGPINFSFFGLNLSGTPDIFFFKQADSFSWASFGLFMIPIVSAILALLSMKVNMHINQKILHTGNAQSNATNRQMMIMQPILSLWIGFTLPAALGLYWIANSVFGILQEYVSIGILKKHITTMKEAAVRRATDQKEKVKEQKRLQSEQKKQKAEEARRIKLERSINTNGIAESRVGIRAYAKGRTFDPARYEVTPYHDPDDIVREQSAARKKAKGEQEVAKAEGGKGKKNKKSKEALPTGMVLNEAVRRENIPEAPAVEEVRPNESESEKTED